MSLHVIETFSMPLLWLKHYRKNRLACSCRSNLFDVIVNFQFSLNAWRRNRQKKNEVSTYNAYEKSHSGRNIHSQRRSFRPVTSTNGEVIQQIWTKKTKKASVWQEIKARSHRICLLYLGAGLAKYSIVCSNSKIADHVKNESSPDSVSSSLI